jgi:hypothetical protein
LIALLHPLICSSGAKSGLPVYFHCFSGCAEAGSVVAANNDTMADSRTIITGTAARAVACFAGEPSVLR